MNSLVDVEESGDKAILMEIAASGQNEFPLRRSSLKLLRQFEHHQDIKDFFYGLWKN
jgi:hypothetical protein